MSLRKAIFILALGICVSLGGEVRAASLVTNGGFETGDFTGWTVSGNGIAIDQVFPNNGCCDAVFSSTNTDSSPGTLSQIIATNTGGSYSLSFAFLDEAGFSGDSFNVTFGGFSTTITGDQAGPPGTLPSGYTPFLFFIPGGDVTGASTTLSFQGLNDPSNGGTAALNLDDVSLSCSANCAPSATPIPSGLPLFGSAILLWFTIVFFRKRGFTLSEDSSPRCG